MTGLSGVESVMAALDVELDAYLQRVDQLRPAHEGRWVVFKGPDLIGIYDTLDAAAGEAASRFGRGPYLIRQIGEPPIVIPASVVYLSRGGALPRFDGAHVSGALFIDV